MSLVTVTLRPARTISVVLQIGAAAPVAVLDPKMSVLLSARQVVVGPPGVSGATRAYSQTTVPVMTPNADAYDLVEVTAQTTAVLIANPSPVVNLLNGQRLSMRIKDNGVARALTFGAQYRGLAVTLPTTTVAGKTMYLGFIYNTFDAKWDLLAFANQL